MTGLEVSDVHDNALQIVRAGPSELKVLPRVLAAGSVCVGQHLKLQGKRYFGIDLRGRAYMLFEALDVVLDMGSLGWENFILTLS